MKEWRGSMCLSEFFISSSYRYLPIFSNRENATGSCKTVFVSWYASNIWMPGCNRKCASLNQKHQKIEMNEWNEERGLDTDRQQVSKYHIISHHLFVSSSPRSFFFTWKAMDRLRLNTLNTYPISILVIYVVVVEPGIFPHKNISITIIFVK